MSKRKNIESFFQTLSVIIVSVVALEAIRSVLTPNSTRIISDDGLSFLGENDAESLKKIAKESEKVNKATF